jgi:hypothetical protein
MKILVCDDEPSRSDEIIKSIEAGRKIKPDPPLVGKELRDEFSKFYKAINPCLDNPQNCHGKPDVRFNDADIIILDNNLATLDPEGTRLVAESFIGHIRTFAAAPYIISLNKNPAVDFDLKYLIGDYETQADVALNTEHLANPALWTGDQSTATKGFIPWYWPRLNFVADRRRSQINFVSTHLETPFLESLGFRSEAISFLSRHAAGTLSPRAVLDAGDVKGIPIRELTFLQIFTETERSLPVQKERKDLTQAAANNDLIKEMIARDVAARIDLWFRKDVVGPQDALVDLPHLLIRLPFLLGEKAGDINAWNKVIRTPEPPYGLDQELYEKHLKKHQFSSEYDFWLPSSPCFWWPDLKAEDELNEYFFKAKEGDWADCVFCEDRSQFLRRSEENGDSPVEFATEFEGSWTRRYVSLIQDDDIQYSPKTRLAE